MAPAAPHSAVLVPGWHWLFVSQQPEQFDALHTGFWQVPLQVSPAGQATQVTPPLPQRVTVSPAWQPLFPSQQPEQVEALQDGL